jgi:Fe-S cluster assembly protein SufD
VTQDRDSSYSSFVATLGGALSRKDLQVTMDGTGSTCTLNGLYLMGGNQFADHHTVIEHLKPHGSSRETYKGILAGASRAVFNGKIVVGKEAQKTDARQSNKNLLLSDGARINTKPQLEILADDVKCSHGAAIGHLDDDALFYLRSRGIGESLARTLMFGFVQEVSGEIRRAPLREKIEFILQQNSSLQLYGARDRDRI